MLSRILCLFFSSRGWMVGLIQTILYCVFVGYIVIESYVRRMERWLYMCSGRRFWPSDKQNNTESQCREKYDVYGHLTCLFHYTTSWGHTCSSKDACHMFITYIYDTLKKGNWANCFILKLASVDAWQNNSGVFYCVPLEISRNG